jgi:hypothetical protein
MKLSKFFFPLFFYALKRSTAYELLQTRLRQQQHGKVEPSKNMEAKYEK